MSEKLEEFANLEDQVRYVISVAAELAGMHPQTLRQYDRLGLVSPSRTKGRGRRYTRMDVELLRHIQRLSQEEGINLAGIRRIIDLERQLEQAQSEVRRLRAAVTSQDRVFHAGPSGEVRQFNRAARMHTLAQERGLTRVDRSSAVVVWRP